MFANLSLGNLSIVPNFKIFWKETTPKSKITFYNKKPVLPLSILRLVLLFYGRRSVAAARYRMICIVFVYLNLLLNETLRHSWFVFHLYRLMANAGKLISRCADINYFAKLNYSRSILSIWHSLFRRHLRQVQITVESSKSHGSMNSWVSSVVLVKLIAAAIVHQFFSIFVFYICSKHNIVLYTWKIPSLFYFGPFRPLTWVWILNWANWIINKVLHKKIEEWTNSRLGKSVSDLYRSKIILANSKLYIVYIKINWNFYKKFNNNKKKKYKKK